MKIDKKKTEKMIEWLRALEFTNMRDLLQKHRIISTLEVVKNKKEI